MQQYHQDTEGISEDVNTLEDAQKRSKRAGNPITEETLFLIATNTMLSTERFPQAYVIWEDLPRNEKY